MTALSNTLKTMRPLGTLLNDRIVALMAVLTAVLTVLDSDQAIASLNFTGAALLHMAPFFAAAIAFAAYARASGMDQTIARVFAGNTWPAVLAGSLAGALSPFCSCGVIPLMAGMLASGVPLAPVMAFCMASPVMDPEMFLLTTAGIHLEFAVAKTLTAIALGLVAGTTVMGLQKRGDLQQPLKKAAGCGCGNDGADDPASRSVAWRIWREPSRRKTFTAQLRSSGLFLGKWMALAFLLESLMVAYVPGEAIAPLVGPDNVLAIPLAALVGIPAYLNGYAAIPLISGLMTLGMTPGAGLAFATAGAVSSLPAALAVYAIVKREVFFLYIGLGTVGAIAAGYLYQLIKTL
jgi:uncharacterized membrane protein YraQ (UPF0718 family)